jgi:transcriptional regulator with XRE-family HTH domain
MWEIENKEVARPSAEKLHRIAVALETTLDYLIAADEIAEADAADTAFFRKYQKMKPRSKDQRKRCGRPVAGSA